MPHLLFLLPMLAAAPAADAPPPAPGQAQAAPARDSARQICKRKARTGSLADVERICHTKAEWDALAARTQDEWQALQGTQGSTHSMEPGMQAPPVPH